LALTVHNSLAVEFEMRESSNRKTIGETGSGLSSDNYIFRALTQDICYRARAVASGNLLPVRMPAGATYDEAAQHDNKTGID
jgi:hypothetical protein